LIQKNIKPHDANVFMIVKLLFHSRTLLALSQSRIHNKLGSVRQCHSQLLIILKVWIWRNIISEFDIVCNLYLKHLLLSRQ